jgi:hypothetical protein
VSGTVFSSRFVSQPQIVRNRSARERSASPSRIESNSDPELDSGVESVPLIGVTVGCKSGVEVAGTGVAVDGVTVESAATTTGLLTSF